MIKIQVKLFGCCWFGVFFLILFYFPTPNALKGPLGFILNSLPSPRLCGSCCPRNHASLTDEGWRLFSTSAKPFLAQVMGQLLPGTLNQPLIGKFWICLMIALEHSESQLEGNQLLYQYPELPKTIASFQGLFPRKPEFPFSSFLTCHCFCSDREICPHSARLKAPSVWLWHYFPCSLSALSSYLWNQNEIR